jgi:hypothetical protein
MMRTVGSCVLTGCLWLCGGLIGAAGTTLGDAALRYDVVARVLMLVVFGVFSVLAWLLYQLPTWLDSAHYLSYLPTFAGCSGNATDTSTFGVPGTIVSWLLQHEFGVATLGVPERLCYGSLSAYRVMLVLSVYHALMAVAMIGADRLPGRLRTQVQHGWWAAKLLVLASALAFVFLAVGNGAILAYAWAALVGAGLFILVQIALTVEFAHRASARAARAHRAAVATGGRCARCAMGWGVLSGTLGGYAAAAAFLGLAYASFGVPCPAVLAGLSATVALAVFITLGAVLAYRSRRAGLLPASLVCAYGAYLAWSALAPLAMYDAGCQPVAEVTDGGGGTAIVYLTRLAGLHDLSRGTQDVILLAAGLVALAYSAFRTASDVAGDADHEFSPLPDEALEAAPLGPAPEPLQGPVVVVVVDAQRPAAYSFAAFHGVLLLACMYTASVITGFSVLGIAAPSGDTAGRALFMRHTAATLWIKLVWADLLLLVFLWTVYAPLCCRRRGPPPLR